MSKETNRHIARRIPLEVFNEGKLEVIDELTAPDFLDHAYEGLPWGFEGLKRVVAVLRSAFSDLCYTLEDEVVDGDKVVLRLTACGTNDGELLGIPPTGRKARWTEIHIVRVVGDRMVEHWASVDHLSMIQQLGIDPLLDHFVITSPLDEWYRMYPGF